VAVVVVDHVMVVAVEQEKFYIRQVFPHQVVFQHHLP
jgi:hypothetical protein